MEHLKKLIREQVEKILNESIYDGDIPTKESIYDSLGDLVIDGKISQISFKSMMEDKQMSLFGDQKKDFKDKVKTGEDDKGEFKAIVSNEVGDYMYKIMISGFYELNFEKEGETVIDRNLTLTLNPKNKVQVLCVNKETSESKQFAYPSKGLDHLTDVVSDYFYDRF